MTRKLANLFPALLVILLVFASYLSEFISPSFPGDAGIRLAERTSLIVHYGDRVWLPFLQAHLVVLSSFEAALVYYKLVPFSYLSLFLLALNVSACKVFGLRGRELIFVVSLLFGLAFCRPVHLVGIHLYQEVLALFFFSALFCLHYGDKKRPVLFGLMLGASLLVREYFWIYLAVYLLLALGKQKKHLSAKGLPVWFCVLSTIPLWLLLSGQGSGLAVHVPRPEFGVWSVISRVFRISLVFRENSLDIACLSALACGFLLYRSGGRVSIEPSQPAAERLADYNRFSFISLNAIYAYIVLVDPWQITPFNFRMAIPLLLHLPFWFFMLYRDARAVTSRRGRFVEAILFFAVLSLAWSARG